MATQLSNRRRLASVIFALSLVVAAGLVWFGLAGQGSPVLLAASGGGDVSSAVLRDIDGRAIVVEPAPDAELAAITPTGGRFMAPSLDLDVPLYAMSAQGTVLNPPSLTDAFMLRSSRISTPVGTTPLIVTMHAVRGGTAPGNAFFEVETSTDTVRVAVGDALYVDGSVYTVTAVEILSQDDASASPYIWGVFADGEDRLVVLTCVQRPGRRGFATENLVIHALRPEQLSSSVGRVAASAAYRDHRNPRLVG